MEQEIRKLEAEQFPQFFSKEQIAPQSENV